MSEIQRWDYVTAGYERWNGLGQLGWELVAVGKDFQDRDMGYFKRPVTNAGRSALGKETD